MIFRRISNMLLCSDVATARDFYVRTLGLSVNADIGWFVGMERETPTGHFELSLCAAGHATLSARASGTTQGLIMAFEVDDTRALAEELRADGATILEEPKDEPWGQRHFFVAAPDGVVLDFFEMTTPDPQWLKDNGFA